MTAPGPRRPTGASSVESCIVAALLVTALLAGRGALPRALSRALETAMATFASAVGTELP